LLCISFAASFVAAACRDRANAVVSKPPSASASANVPLASTTPAAESGKLPEDPDAGARSVAEWRQHLEREERERQLGYDRRRLPAHHEVLKTLRDARRTYDRAGSKNAVLSAQAGFRAKLAKLDASFDAIDHWGVSSKVLPDYRKLAETFTDAYPDARLAALAGDASGLERIGPEVDARFAAIEAWLREAAESEDE
jgi:hypothetical protein